MKILLGWNNLASLGLAYPIQNLLRWVLFIRDELTAMYSQTRATTGTVYEKKEVMVIFKVTMGWRVDGGQAFST